MRPNTHTLRWAVAGLILLLSTLPGRAVELLMVEQPGCHYCARWNAEIAPIYPKTAEGRFAPLRRVRLGSAELAKLDLSRRVIFTPTFVLIGGSGQELTRLEGYPGEDFFWGLLERMLLDATEYAPTPSAGGS